MQNWLPLTQSVSDWLLTSQCFTTRFSTLQIVLAILPNRLLTRQLLSWIHWVRSHTKDSTLIMQLLRDNLTLWTSDMQDDAADEIKEAAPKTGDE
ncbi:hypothetical protein OIU79_000698 [Salix purpurea]|uniref:Uncharacterized protein n=1 Tax=Salix purpurea TaxID=77065 RepID=A0A9Q0V3W9_SALPP|nr:hypothetical protein OIU79_000698 [Salix purpurea]